MRILPQSLLVIFAVVIQNNVLVSAVPANGTLDTPIKVVHCPFKVTASLAGDLSSIDLIYSTSSSAKTLFGQNKAVCFVRVQFRFSPMEYVSTQELEYEGKFQEKDGGGEIETKAAWDANMTPSLGSLGPVCSEPASVIRVKLKSSRSGSARSSCPVPQVERWLRT